MPTTLLRVDASFRTEGSISRAVADSAQSTWLREHPAGVVVHRDLGSSPLPSEAWALAVGAAYTPEEQRTEEQRAAVALAATLADELVGADALVLATPLYNFGVSQHTKTWLDLLIAEPRLGPGTEALRGKPALLVVAQGGGYRAGTPREGWDHATPYLQRILGDLWGMDCTTVVADLTLASSTPAMADLVGVAEQSLATAHREAEEHASALAARLRAAA
jgi:FMN-dependent NADH-azoreductase